MGQFFENYLRLDTHEEEQFRHEFDKISPEEQTAMLEFTTSWHEKGREEKALEVARRLLAMDLTIEQIQEATELPKDRIENLRAESANGK